MSKVKLPSKLVNADGSVTVKLKKPFAYGEGTVDTLTFKEPKAKHLKKMKLQAPDLSDVLALAGALCGEAPSLMDELSADDTFYIAGVISDFLPDSGGVGRTD